MARALRPDEIQEWLNQNGYYSVGAAGSVTLYNYDAEEGLIFEAWNLPQPAGGDLTKAHELAQRFMRDVPNPDDVGFEECSRLARKWFEENYPGGLWQFGDDDSEPTESDTAHSELPAGGTGDRT